jgi:hypothetical protein
VPEENLNQTLQRLDKVGLNAKDGSNAKAGKRSAAARIYEALRIIAEEKGQTLEGFDHLEGTRVFELKPLDNE